VTTAYLDESGDSTYADLIRSKVVSDVGALDQN